MLSPNVILCCVAIFSQCLGFSQTVNKTREIFKEKKEIVYGLDNRRTHIYEHHTVIYGLYSGISFGKKLRVKLGASGTPFEVGKFLDDNGLLKRNRLLFFSLGEEFDFFQYKKLGMTSYLQAGMGNNYFRRFDSYGQLVNEGRQFIIPLETGLHFSYEMTSYLRLKTGFGWRFVLPNYSKGLSGYYVKLGLSFSYKKFRESRNAKGKQT